MKRTLIAGLLLAAGCSGPRAGDTYVLTGGASLFTDEAGIRDEGQRSTAGTRLPGDDFMRLIAEGRIVVLNSGATVKVVERSAGAVKVAVIGGSHAGKLGWLLDKELPDADQESR